MRNFDELKSRSVPYEEYFSGMNLTGEQKKQRISAARDFEDGMLFLFSLINVMTRYKAVNEESIVSQTVRKYLSTISKYMSVDDYIEDYAKQFSQNTVRATLSNIEDAYYLSDDRAMFIAENEAQSMFEHKEFSDAVAQGKTQKQWIGVDDKRERDTHREINGEVVPINRAFAVGNSLMMYPKDVSLGADAEEIVNCRCTVKYF